MENALLMKLSNDVEKVWNWGNQNGSKLLTFSYSVGNRNSNIYTDIALMH